MTDRPQRAGPIFAALGLALMSAFPAPAGGQDVRFAAKRIGPRLVLVTDARMGNNIAAVRTSRGLVVVDTGETVEAGRTIREIIEGEFPGEPFVYVINTHSHWDHVLGNPAYAEAAIVAHENARQAMMKVEKRPPAASSSQTPPPPPPLGRVGVAAEFLEDTLPDLTFTDRMTLDCGDRTIRLVHYGDGHTPSDILVLVPEDKAVFVGDLFFKGQLPGFNEWLAPDVARWRAVLDEVLGEPDLCGAVIPGHGAVIPRSEFEIQVRYVFELWDGLARAFREGRTLEEVAREFAIASRYPGLAAWNIKDSAGRTIHDENIRRIWKHLAAGLGPLSYQGARGGKEGP